VSLAGFDAATGEIENLKGNNFSIFGTTSSETFDLRGLTSVAGLGYVDAGSGTDTLLGSQFDDDLRGGSGNDTVYGGANADKLSGNDGADIFVFKSANESASSTRDTIQDFVSGVDKIDLLNIDANTKLSSNQAFSYIGGGAFSGKAGELRFDNTLLSGDINGDKVPDFLINVSGVSSLAASDIYL
jgi:serralysin